MKIVGIEEWLIWVNWFLYGITFSVISYTVVTIMLQYEFSGPNSAAIRTVDPMLLWLFIMMYCVANIIFTFMFTAIFHQSTFVHFTSSFYSFSVIFYFKFTATSHLPIFHHQII